MSLGARTGPYTEEQSMATVIAGMTTSLDGFVADATVASLASIQT
jgi:hypothetical protein